MFSIKTVIPTFAGITALLTALQIFSAHAENLESVLNGHGNAADSLSGFAVGYAVPFDRHYTIIAQAKGCARFTADGKTCAQPLTPDSLIRIASLSKLVTSIGVMKLVEQKKLDLDADISSYLGFSLRNPTFPNMPITVRLLMTHNSSIRDGGEKYWAAYPHSLQELFTPGSSLWDKGVHFDSNSAPGKQFVYTNLNYGVLATIVERVSGERFDRYMTNQIFQPLGINAGYNWSGAETISPEKIAALYRRSAKGDAWEPQIDDFKGGAPTVQVRTDINGTETQSQLANNIKIGENGTLFSPQGGLRISVRDLARIGAMLAGCGKLNGVQILECKTVQDMMKPQWRLSADSLNGDSEDGFYTAWGIGMHLISWRQHKVLYPGHFADAYGLRGAMLIDPDTRTVGVYLINGFATNPEKLKSDVPGVAKPEAVLIDMLTRQMAAAPKPRQLHPQTSE